MREERKAYPIVISKEEDGFYYVSIPDFDIATQGESIADAMEMARDAIGIMGIDYLDDGKVLPEPNTKEVDNKAVKKNCTIPYWLNVEAEKAGINYSKVLQDAIMRVLGINKGVN